MQAESLLTTCQLFVVCLVEIKAEAISIQMDPLYFATAKVLRSTIEKRSSLRTAVYQSDFNVSNGRVKSGGASAF